MHDLPPRAANGVHRTLSRWYGSRLGVFAQSLLIGALTGGAVVLFRVLLQAAEQARATVYQLLRGAPLGAWLGWLGALTLLGLLLGLAAVRRPMIRGSGIPQVKGALARKMRLDTWPDLPLKIITGVAAVGAGLSLGREGPSVQIGAYVGKGVLSYVRRPAVERKYLITSGAAAGLAAAFNAPIAGVLFALEELHRHFSPLLLACAMGASVVGDIVAGHFFGLGPVFRFDSITPLPIHLLPWVIVLGVVSVFVGDLFKRALLGAQDLYIKLRIPPAARIAVALLLTVPVALVFFPATGGGHELIQELAQGHFGVRMMIALLIAKGALTALSYGSGASGGIFLPMLAIGALMGKIFGVVLTDLGVIAPGAQLNFMIIGMAALFTGVVRAPITGAVLIVEMSGNLNHFSGLIVGCLTAFVVANLIRSRPIYDQLMDRLLERNPGIYVPSQSTKIVLEIPVATGSQLSHTRIRNISWPPHTLVVGIERGDHELLPNGTTEILPGDLLLVLAHDEHAAAIKDQLLAMGECRR